MRVIVTEACIDKYTQEFYPAGCVIEVTEERAAEMESYVRPVDQPVKKTRRSRKAKT